jgi:hypothetical protein
MESFLQHGLQENAPTSIFPFVEWRHGYAFFIQLQRFHVQRAKRLRLINKGPSDINIVSRKQRVSISAIDPR